MCFNQKEINPMKKLIFAALLTCAFASTAFAAAEPTETKYVLAPNPFYLDYYPGKKLSDNQEGIELIYEQWKEVDEVTMAMQDRIANILKSLHQ